MSRMEAFSVTSAEHDLQSEHSRTETPKVVNRRYWYCAGVGFVLCLLVVIRMIVLQKFSELAIAEFVTLNDDAIKKFCNEDRKFADLSDFVTWPGCKGTGSEHERNCGEPCFNDELFNRLRSVAFESSSQIVSYMSRPGVGYRGQPIEIVKLRGWLIQASGPASPPRPRIVVQHGFKENSNKFRQLLAASMLLTSGFDILLNNFRDHCYSDSSSAHTAEWGHAYPYDLLGAWDYLRKDPDGILGGELPSTTVGMMGFSLGAFTALNAFGMSDDIPAVWVDSPPYAPKQVFEASVKTRLNGYGVGFTSSLFVSSLWGNCVRAAQTRGVNPEANLPEKVLPRGPDTARPVYMVGNFDDNIVPIGAFDMLLDLFKKFPEKYHVRKAWKSKGSCKGLTHCVDHLQFFDTYSSELCAFWKESFNLSTAPCRTIQF